MKDLTQKEFAMMCGIRPNHIRTYEKRGKVEVLESGHVDLDNILNKSFYEMRRQEGKGKDYEEVISQREKTKKEDQPKQPAKKAVQKKKTVAKKKPRTKAVNKKPKASAKQPEKKADMKVEPNEPEKPKEPSELTKLQLEERRLKLVSQQREIELKEMQIAKQQGLVIPTELVINTIQIQAEAMKVAYHDATEKFIMIMAQSAKLTPNQIAKIRTDLIDLINDTIKDTVQESKKSISLIVDEYTNKRGVGQKIAI